jgi:hypothetical protein
MSRKKRNLLLAGTLIVLLLVTGGTFGGAWFTGTNTGSATTEADFANVSGNTTFSITDVHGGEIGNVTAQSTVFDLGVDNTYTGDLLVRIYMVDSGNLLSTFEDLQLKMNVTSSGATITPSSYQLLTLETDSVYFKVTGYTPANGILVDIDGGSYHAQPGIETNDPDVHLFCQVIQGGLDAA